MTEFATAISPQTPGEAYFSSIGRPDIGNTMVTYTTNGDGVEHTMPASEAYGKCEHLGGALMALAGLENPKAVQAAVQAVVDSKKASPENTAAYLAAHPPKKKLN